MGRYLPALFKVLLASGGPDKLNGPFSALLEEERITDKFILNWLGAPVVRTDASCAPQHWRLRGRPLSPCWAFGLMSTGATVSDAPTTLMAYMLSDFYREGVCLDFPKGGTAAIVDAR
eukprot:5718184-Prymnesium_polylepis.2